MAPGTPEDFAKLQEMVRTESLVIIPAGFRCYTKIGLEKKLGLKQQSMPFDNGFFPPQTIASLLERGAVDLAAPSFSEGHVICKKYENFVDPVFGKGVKFVRSSYEEIDALAIAPDMPNINHLLDNTFGYYTLDTKNLFVLAHYNWHRFGVNEKNGRDSDVQANIRLISHRLTLRLERLRNKCSRADRVVFMVGETQGYKYMQIDDDRLDLQDFAIIADTARRKFGNKCHAMRVSEIASPKDVFDKIL